MSGAKALLTVCVVAGLATLTHAVQVTDCSLPSSGVFVAIGSDVDFIDDQELRSLVVNWFGIDAQDGDYLQLVNSGTGEELMRLSTLEPDGWAETNVTWDSSLIPDNIEDVVELCLPYQANYVRDEFVLYSSCLTLRPRWMESMKEDLWDTRLTKVVIPGAHDAGATSYFGSLGVENIVARWTITQDESLWQQLVLGARYHDMRISYYNGTEEKFYINHGEIVIAPLRRYIDFVVDFMNSTDEIVIFDIHQLVRGFDGYPERKQELIDLLESNFKPWMAPRSLAPNPTMSELWTDDNRLIVTFPASHNSDHLWDSVHHLWGDANTLEDLKDYLYNGIPQQVNRGALWSTMAQLTPSPLDVTLNKWGGLRGAAEITNFPVTNWFRQDWWDQVNIVAMDFLPFSDVIFVAVEANKMRVLCQETRKNVIGD